MTHETAEIPHDLHPVTEGELRQALRHTEAALCSARQAARTLEGGLALTMRAVELHLERLVAALQARYDAVRAPPDAVWDRRVLAVTPGGLRAVDDFCRAAGGPAINRPPVLPPSTGG